MEIPNHNMLITWGKHKGQTFEWVHKNDPDYVRICYYRNYLLRKSCAAETFLFYLYIADIKFAHIRYVNQLNEIPFTNAPDEDIDHYMNYHSQKSIQIRNTMTRKLYVCVEIKQKRDGFIKDLTDLHNYRGM